jgi:cyclopropane fatty-acyl-phospholipid synthase-like methyltransferase
MTPEAYAEHWLPRATARAEDGVLDAMVARELFDHTWIASVRELDRHLRFAAGQTVLDAGCGWGRLLLGVKYLCPGVAIDGYELTPEFCRRARELVAEHGLADGVRIVEADLLEAALPKARYDALYCSRVVHYIERKDLLLAKFHAALKSGGRAMIVIPNRDCPYQRLRYKHAPLYPIRSVARLMESAGFTDVRCGGYRIVPASRRFAHDSLAARVDRALSATPLGRFGGLAYAVGTK